MSLDCRIFVLGPAVLLLLGCGTQSRTPVVPCDSGTALAPADAQGGPGSGDVEKPVAPDAGAAADASSDGKTGGIEVDTGSPSALGRPWTLIALPDTQYYSSSYPQIFEDQIRWILDNKTERNILYVVHEGDIVDDSVDGQWSNASRSLHLLDFEVPYVLAVGDHDYPGAGGATSRGTTLFDKYFSMTSLDWQSTFRGTCEPGTVSNSFHLFEANGQMWLIVSLEFGPRDIVLAWADRVLKTNASANAIVLTHAYLYSDGTRFDHRTRMDQALNPHSYGVEALPGGVNDGEEIWQKLIVKNPNVRMVLCGHAHAESHLTSTRDAGPPVHQILADYEDAGQGGDGYLRVMTFQPNGAIKVSSYSPYLKQSRTDPEDQFTLSL